MTSAQIVAFIAQALVWVCEAGGKALEGPTPATTQELALRIETALRERATDWIAQQKAEADAAYEAAIKGA